ncbi:MAG: flagellar hook-basal body complex protein FliE [Alphaproteobacteria bacterium]
MAVNFIDAVSAYRKAGAVAPGSGGAGSVGASEGAGFADILQQVAGGTVASLKHAEQVSQLGVLGKTSPVEIATAVAGAETSLQMLVSIRDRMIGAYQEITRMGI